MSMEEAEAIAAKRRKDIADWVMRLSLFAAAKAFADSDPYHVNGVWDAVEIHAYHKKRG